KQAEKLAALPKEFKLPGMVSFETEASDEAERRKQAIAIEKRLGEVLTPAQVRELMQITMRNYPLSANLTGVVSPHLLALAELGEQLKLTPRQLQRIERGAFLEEVLEPKQRQTWEELVGKPFARPAPTSPIIVVPPLYPYGSLTLTQLNVLSDPSVQKELK